MGVGAHVFERRFDSACCTVGGPHTPIQWVPGAVSLGVKRPEREADHSPPSTAKIKKSGPIPPLPHTSLWRGA
jgi:hypothetical protein